MNKYQIKNFSLDLIVDNYNKYYNNSDGNYSKTRNSRKYVPVSSYSTSDTQYDDPFHHLRDTYDEPSSYEYKNNQINKEYDIL